MTMTVTFTMPVIMTLTLQWSDYANDDDVHKILMIIAKKKNRGVGDSFDASKKSLACTSGV